jgi:hypothetical protein
MEGCPAGERKEAVTRTHFSSRDQFGNLPVTIGTIGGLDEMHHSITDRLSSPPAVQCAFR